MHEKMMQRHAGSGGQSKLLAYDVALKGKKLIAERTYTFTFERPKDFNFTAGQHIRMTLIDPAETDEKGNSRFFSLASSPSEKDLVIVMRIRDTAFKRVLGTMPVGAKIRMQMLQHVHASAFVLHEDASRPAVFLVGGIGIAPVFSMFKDATEKKLPHNLVLFYSNRQPQDAPFLSELKKLAVKNPNLKLVATMTKPDQTPGTWKGETSHINLPMLEKNVNNLQAPIYYLAGLPDMVSAMKTMLKDAGIKEDSVRAEEFTGFNLNEIVSEAENSKRSYLSLIAIALLIVGLVVVHVTGAKSLVDYGLSSLSFNNPLSYLVVGLIIGMVAMKLGFIVILKRKGKSILGMHRMSRKGR